MRLGFYIKVPEQMTRTTLHDSFNKLRQGRSVGFHFTTNSAILLLDV